MARAKNEGLWDRWRERLWRFDSGELTVTAFCEQEEVSPAAFYQWRKKLRTATRTPPAVRSRKKVVPARSPVPGHAECSSFLPVLSLSSSVVLTLVNGVRVEVPGCDDDLVAHAVRVAGTIGGAS